jgi:hypothetical protein
MSAPPGDVVDRLEQLAAHAPAGGIDPDAVWTHGRRRQRVRLGAALAAVVAVGLLGTTTTPLLVERAQRVEPADAGERMVLPDVVRQPGAWEPAFPSAPGRLSAVAIGTRGSLLGDHAALWGVSATTGESRFLDLPVAEALVDQAVLSADGTRLAYWASTGDAGERSDGQPSAATGLNVLDLVTGEQRGWDPATEHGLMTVGLAWAGDTVWFTQGAYRDADQDSARISTRTWRWGSVPEPVEGPPADDAGLTTTSQDAGGFLAASGSAATEAWRVDDGGSVGRIRFVADEAVTTPYLSPDGSRVAGIEQGRGARFILTDLPLLVGTLEGDRAVMQRVGPVEAELVLGWRSPTEVVVGAGADRDGDGVRDATRASLVDVTDGSMNALLDIEGNLPDFAADAWTAEVVPAPDAPFAPDPRLVGLGLLVAAFVGWRIAVRVRGRRVHA